MKRWREIDALRGFMLVMMTFTHLPTRFSGPMGQPLGFVSAAEGFVFLSAFMVGYIFSRRALKDGLRGMRQALLRRALKLYASHVAMLAYLFTLIAAIGIKTDRQAIKNLISFYLQEPATAFASSLFLIYNPPLLDILPMYVMFMVLSPWILMAGLRWSWTPVIVASAVLWFAAQFGLDKEVYHAAGKFIHSKVPFDETGAFQLFAWQLIWILGLWLGARTVAGVVPRFPTFVLFGAFIVAAMGFSVRHGWGQAPFSDASLAALLSKWHLGPLRLLNFIALLALALRFGQHLKTVIRWRFLETLGAASLPVFCVHLGMVLLTLAVIGDRKGVTSLGLELAVLAATFLAMFATARLLRSRDAADPGGAPHTQAAISARAAR